MLGYVRFILAVLVALSHVGVTIFGQNPGVVAVVVFYMLAGNVVTYLMTKIFPIGLKALPLFYFERFLRIYPLYFFIFLLTLVFILITGFGNPIYSLGRIADNLLIVPLNYYMIIDSTILDVPNGRIIPPSWSLGAELQAYILLPLIIRYKRPKIILALLTFCVFTTANLSFIHTDYFGYRLLLGVFFIFILGSCIYKVVNTQMADFFDKFFPLFVYALALVTLMIIIFTNNFNKSFTSEVVIGLLLAMPIVYFGSSKKIRLAYNGLFGSLSYGVFLSHFLVIWILTYYFPDYDIKQVSGVVCIIGISVLIALVGIYAVEKPIMGLRRKLSSWSV